MRQEWRLTEPQKSWWDGREIINLERDVYDEDGNFLGQEYLRNHAGEVVEFETREAAREYADVDFFADLV